MAVPLETLVSYVPRRLLRRFARGEGAAPEPGFEVFSGALLFVDISGFTDLTERLARKGPGGTEELTSILNSYFGRLLDLISDHGGDTLKMAGDGLVVAWETEDSYGAREPAIRAVQCAEEIQRDRSSASSESRLTVRIGIGFGETHIFYVGGLFNRWELIPIGEPLRQMGIAQSRAKPGEIVVSADCWAALSNGAEGEPLDSGLVRIRRLRATLPSRALPDTWQTKVARDRIEKYVPAAVRYVLHEAGESWLGELRPLTILFVNLPQVPGIQPELSMVQELATALQKIVYRFEGSVNKWTVDEKGMNFIAAYGLPPLSHEDDPYRAIRAATSIHETLKAMGVQANYGIATGRAFCGSIGSPQRREYAIIGAVVNLAARLAEQSSGEIYCDLATFQASSSRLQFAALPMLRLKGSSRPVAAFQPSNDSPAIVKAAALIGRKAELNTLVQAIDALKAGQTFVAFVEGEAGIGKSTLIRKWSQAAELAGVRLVSGAAEAIQAATPYFIWKNILETLFKIPSSGTPEQRRLYFLATCQGAPWAHLAPLLEDILEIGIPDNSITAQITGKSRANSTRELIANLVDAEVKKQPLAIVLEDCHWMDSASLALAVAVAKRIQPPLMIFSSRPALDGKQQTHWEEFDLPWTHRIVLKPLEAEECITLAAQRLGVRSLSKPVADLIVARSQGNPFFSVEIAYALRENGFVLIEGDQCKAASGLQLETVKFPDSIQGIIARRVDSLETLVQFAAKVASVIGQKFPISLLRDIYPIEHGKAEIEGYLRTLEQERLLSRDDDETYKFSHAIVQEVVYDRMLLSQRKMLHEKVALALENNRALDPEAVAPLLAYHWAQAGNEQKAARFFSFAGQWAVRTGAYQEGLDFLENAIRMADPHPVGKSEVLNLGRSQRMRAEALLGLGQLDESRKAVCEAARILGHPVPKEKPTRDLVREIRMRVADGVSTLNPSDSGHAEDGLRELVAAYEMLSLLDLFANNMNSSLSAALEMLGHAEELGDSAEYARALAALALASSLVPARFEAKAYAREALRVAENLNQEAALSRVLELTSMYYLGEARWSDTDNGFRHAIKGFQVVGDRRREIECTCLLSTSMHYQGKFAERVLLGRHVSRVGLASGDLQAQAWGLLDQIESLLNLGDLESAGAVEAELGRHIGQNIYGADQIMAFGLLASLEQKIGHPEEACRFADLALALMTRVTPTIVYNLEAYAAVAEVYLLSWADPGLPEAKRTDLGRKANEACRNLRVFARVFRIGRPRALLLTGREFEICGDRQAALRATNKSLACALRLGMPYEEALGRRQLAKLLPAADPQKSHQLKQALALFSRLGEG
jgi:class 3 adenylate cyclase/tetratricopeptide (TPR) repeat protein